MEQQQKIGRYEIIDRIGRGMQGTVYKARDPELDRLVAIKLLHSGSPGTSFVEAAEAGPVIPLEARISSRLRHPNIVSIFDCGFFHGNQYLVFEYVEGRTLRQILGSQGNIPIPQICRLARPIVDAIACAHDAGVVHLDLSPRNILVDAAGNPRVMDFGLSQFSQSYVQTGDEIRGTPLYMSPEYFTGAPLGPYTDVYALGASFYQLVVGEPVVGGTTIVEIARQIQHGKVDLDKLPACEQRAGFAAVLRACLEKDYRRRVGNGAELKLLFERFLSQFPVDDRKSGSEIHSTVQFLLRRMQRKADFPGISRILNDINRMTGDGSNAASADKLANVILRDYALTNKLLKTVNSAFFGRSGGDVTSVSKAIVLLGISKVRSIANSLAYFGNIRGGADNKALRDAMSRSFLAGLLTRHLVQRAKQGDAEEGFVCGLFQNLGENLTAYYFPEDHAEIVALAKRNRGDRHGASKQVLGVSFAELGSEVARIWGLPDPIVLAIEGGSEVLDVAATTPAEQLRNLAVFANLLCGIVELPDAAEQDVALGMLISRSAATIGLDAALACRLLAAGMEKLVDNAAMLEIDCDDSPYCRAALAWIRRMDPEPRAEAARGAG